MFVPSWILAALVGAAIVGFYNLLAIWRDVSLLQQSLKDHKEAIDRETGRNDRQDSRLGEQDKTLASILAGIEHIKEGLHKAGIL